MNIFTLPQRYLAFIFILAATPSWASELSFEDGVKVSLQTGIEKINSADFKGALEIIDKILEENPKNAEAYYQRSRLFYNSNQYAQAILDADKAIELKPDYADAYAIRACMKIDPLDLDNARDDCEKALRLDSGNANAYFARALSALQLRSLGHASLKDLEKITKNQDAALKDLDRAIELNLRKDNYYSARALVHLGNKAHDKAIEDYTKAIEVAPDNEGYYLNRGVAYAYESKKLSVSNETKYELEKKALSDFEKVLEINRQHRLLALEYKDHINYRMCSKCDWSLSSTSLSSLALHWKISAQEEDEISD